MSVNTPIAAAVILYYPEPGVLAHIASYYSGIEKLYVMDNTPDGTPLKSELLQLSKVAYYHDGCNEGIAARLNAAARQAVADGFGWLLTMDQDTGFEPDQFEAYATCFRQYEPKQAVALFGTSYSPDAVPLSADCAAVDAENSITSGTLVNLSLLEQTGGFDENLFIDSVDHDYLIRSRLAGFVAIRFTSVFIRHRLGEEVYRSSVKTLFLRKKKKIVHAPLRCYYMFRNLLYLEEKYKGTNDPLAQNLRKIVTGNLATNLFYGRRFGQTLRYLVAAYRDYKRGRMSKREEEA